MGKVTTRRWLCSGLAVLSIGWLSLSAATSSAQAQTTKQTGCTDDSPACMMAAADAYLQALVSHNAGAVPFASTVKRRENAKDTGDSAAFLKNDLQTNPQYNTILGIRDKRWFVAGDEVICYYLLDAGVGVPVVTTHIAERFKITSGLIYEIEAIFVSQLGAKLGTGF